MVQTTARRRAWPPASTLGTTPNPSHNAERQHHDPQAHRRTPIATLAIALGACSRSNSKSARVTEGTATAERTNAYCVAFANWSLGRDDSVAQPDYDAMNAAEAKVTDPELRALVDIVNSKTMNGAQDAYEQIRALCAGGDLTTGQAGDPTAVPGDREIREPWSAK